MPDDHSTSSGTREITTYVGGMRWSGVDVTNPLVRLTLSPSGVEIRVRTPLRARSPGLRYRWSDVNAVRLVRAPVSALGRGVLFEAGAQAIFWSKAVDLSSIQADIERLAPGKLDASASSVVW